MAKGGYLIFFRAGGVFPVSHLQEEGSHFNFLLFPLMEWCHDT
jgi:hypothetical protein